MAINVTLKDTSGSEEKILYPQTLWGNVENKPQWLTALEQEGGVTNTTYTLTLNGTATGTTGGVDLGSFYAPTTSGTSGQVLKSNGSGVEWGSVNYGNIAYNVHKPSATSGTISLDYNNGPILQITLNGTASAVTVSNIPIGHSLHAFFVSSDSSTKTITIANDSTARYCPSGANLVLTAPKSGSGYVEVDFLNANGVTYVRGV